MQHDVRRSDQTDVTVRAEPEPAPKSSSGFARSLFRLGGKRKAAPATEPARLQNRLKEVLERDRALIASEPPRPERDEHEVVDLGHEDVELHELEAHGFSEHEPHDDGWSEQTDPFGAADPEARTGTRTALAPEQPQESEAEEWPVLARWDHASALDEPFAIPAATGTQPTERGVLQLAEARESADLRFSQIASWIEEEISEFPEDAGPLALEAPLDDDEAAELDAVLGGQPSRDEASPAATEAPGAVAPEPVPEAKLEAAVEPAVEAAKPRTAAPASRAQVKAKVSARPAPRDDAPSASKEPINTLTMARLLAMQGYKPRALAVYRELLKRTPDDEALRAEFEAAKKAESPA
ncbi:MAG: hypothetical protein ABW352_12285 [Polyangiales bacterium]